MNYKVEITLFIFMIFLFMKSGNLRAFTFVELLITLSILSLLAVIWYTAVGNKQQNTLNTKVTSEVETLKNALLLAKQENSVLPLPDGNNNFYAIDTSYSHDYENENTYWVHGFITQNTLAKKYIDVIPVDPRTNSYYAYGKTKWSEMYEIASVIFENQEPKSKVIWDYTAQEGPFNLIREYNGPYFVDDNSTQNFAYNPYEKILSAKIWDNSGNITVNGKNLTADEISNIHLVSGDTIEIPQNNNATIYFSDGTVSALWDTSQVTKLTLQNLEFPKQNNLITKVQLVLQSGMIWNKAASLDEESQFEIYTIDSTAAVRGTVFWVQKNSWNSKILVSEWKVAVYKNYENNLETLLEKISTNKTISREQVSSINNNVITIDEETQESIIEVESDESIKWVQIDTQSQWEVEPTNDSVEYIPEEIKKDIIDNRILFSKNIWFWVDTLEINDQWEVETLILKMQKKVWDWLDKISISSSLGTTKQGLSANIEKNNIIDLIEENNQYYIDLSSDIQAGYVSYHLPTEDISQENTISIFSTANADYTKQVWDQKWRNIDLSTDAEITGWTEYRDVTPLWESDDDTTAAWTSWESKNLGTITIKLVQTRNQKNFFSKSVTVPLIKESKISQEKPKDELPLLVREKPILPPLDEDESEECKNSFMYNNINWEEECIEKNDNLDEGWNLVAYAPFNNFEFKPTYEKPTNKEKIYGFHRDTWNIQVHSTTNLIQTWWGACTPGLEWDTFKNNYCGNSWEISWFNTHSHLIQKDGETWVFIDNFNDDTILKYEFWENFKDLNNFVFEINIRWAALKRIDYKNYYLVDNDNFKVYLFKWSLVLNINGQILSIPKSEIDLIINNNYYYNIFIKSNDWEVSLWLDTFTTTELISSDISLGRYQYIWVNKDWTKSQWNDVINYIKIYEK